MLIAMFSIVYAVAWLAMMVFCCVDFAFFCLKKKAEAMIHFNKARQLHRCTSNTSVSLAFCSH
jgi:hypothetical protein